MLWVRGRWWFWGISPSIALLRIRWRQWCWGVKNEHFLRQVVNFPITDVLCIRWSRQRWTLSQTGSSFPQYSCAICQMKTIVFSRVPPLVFQTEHFPWQVVNFPMTDMLCIRWSRRRWTLSQTGSSFPQNGHLMRQMKTMVLTSQVSVVSGWTLSQTSG